jgi:hypothetical protein
MKSNSSCFTSLVVLLAAAVVIRFALPGLWRILAVVFAGTLYAGLVLFVVGLAILGYFIYQNFQKNEQKKQAQKYSHITRTEDLYKSVVDRLQQQDAVLNQVSVEELLQAEILVVEKLPQMKDELLKLKDFTSPKNERAMYQQIREYQQQLKQTSDENVRQVIQQNLNLLEEKRQRHIAAAEDIRQKEATVDLLYHSLANVDEDLKFGRPVQRLFPPDLYTRFGLNPPAQQQQLPPLAEKSSLE